MTPPRRPAACQSGRGPSRSRTSARLPAGPSRGSALNPTAEVRLGEPKTGMLSDNPFLLTVFDRPDDDGPRLVYADWLEERGECDRAELIRLQCQGGDQCRADDLIRAHGARWAGPAARSAYGFAFRRGFVEELTISAR